MCCWLVVLFADSQRGLMCIVFWFVFFFKQKTAYEMRISDWSSDVCSSDLQLQVRLAGEVPLRRLHHLVGGREVDIAVRPVDGRSLERAVAQIGRASCRERVCQYV